MSLLILINSFQNFGRQYKINNLFRPKTVVVDLEKELDNPPLTIEDNSRYVLGQITNEQVESSQKSRT